MTETSTTVISAQGLCQTMTQAYLCMTPCLWQCATPLTSWYMKLCSCSKLSLPTHHVMECCPLTETVIVSVSSHGHCLFWCSD